MDGLEAARSVGMERYKLPHQIADKNDGNTLLFVNEVLRDAKETFASVAKYTEQFNWPSFVRIINVSDGYPSYTIKNMPEAFDEYRGFYGYSSHVHGYADAIIAVARGAKYIEKHVTLDKTESTIRDNHFALSFEEFRQMVEVGSEMERHV